MRAAEIRSTFLGFFQDRGHRVVPSASLIPEDPRAPLLTTAGMVPFIPYFLGEKPIEVPRVASCQVVARTTDIENVGITARHLTTFEMLGNFSFGDYYKLDAIRWAWELATGSFGLDPERIWVTVYENDEEAAQIWRDEVGLADARIIRRGAEDNFWWMGVAGPAGPCSELFYDRGPAYGDADGFVDGDRIMEFYNLVFTEKQVDDQMNVLGDLPQKNVDTGMGFERIAQILQEVATAYDTDVMRPIIARAERLTGLAYGEDDRADMSLRIMSEHARAAAFMVGDGIVPANEDRGYVVRRLIRRAVRHARLLGLEAPIMPGLTESVMETMGEAYPHLLQSRAFIEQILTGEEEGFSNTLRTGMQMLESEIASAEGALGGDVAFKLHDTYGFPLELTVEIARDAGMDVDRERFEALMDEQRERARAAHKIDVADEEALRSILGEAGASAFTGHERDADEAGVVGLVRDGARVTEATEGDEIEIVLAATPFYPEGGGQIGDAGVLETDDGRAIITDTQRRLGDLIVHRARVESGTIAAGALARAIVDHQRRMAVMRSHTATHIVHATLRALLGEHARQFGSLVEPGRLRFDFANPSRVPPEVLAQVEELVNRHVGGDDLVRPYETTMDEARARGAMMLFEEKYGDIVRVVEIGDYSVELCGGTHVTHTSQVGAVKLLGEGSISSGVRRIEALTGDEAITEWRRQAAVLDAIAAILRTTPDEAPARVEKLLADLKVAEQARKKEQGAGARAQAGDLASRAEQVGGTALVIADVPGLAGGDLQKLAIAVVEAIGGPAAVILGSGADGKAAITAALDRQTVGRGIEARALIAEAAKAIGGGAGGRDTSAIGGGKNADGLGQALTLAREAAERLLG